MNIKAFVIGYRQGREGMDPTATVEMTLHELAVLESVSLSNLPNKTQDWAWHLIGWTVGQAVARHGMAG